MTRYTRRRVLASVGLGGIGSAALVGRIVPSGPPWQSYTYAQTPTQERILVAWYETYNGALQEHQGGRAGVNATTALNPGADPAYVPVDSGPVVTVGNVLPGDSGRLAVGIALENRPEGSNPLAIDLTLTLGDESDAGEAEPERVAGGNPPGGTLADEVAVTLWADSGVFPCDGEFAAGDPQIANGSLRSVTSTLASGHRLCEACFPLGVRHRCLGLAWSLPAGTGNEVQTDTVTFGLGVEVHDGTGESPQ